MKMNKQQARSRRAVKTKAIIRKSNRPRLTVRRTNTHIYAQISVTSTKGDQILVVASTLDTELKPALTGNKCEQANRVGELLAKRAKEKNISEVAFDRAGNKYHGRVKAVAEGAREAGLVF